jgi:hypothetical protein
MNRFSSLAPRLVALAASAAVTFSVVALIADYGLPAEGQPLLVQASASGAK